MNILLLNDTSKTSNWGCKATTEGIKHILLKQFPSSHIESIHLDPLPFKKIKMIGRRHSEQLMNSIINGADKETVRRKLATLGVNVDNKWLTFDRVYLNGEGDIHHKSGHAARLIGLLWLLKKHGLYSAAINQSIDFPLESSHAEFIKHTYSVLDCLTVREPLSLDFAKRTGLTKAILVPDAAFSIKCGNRDHGTSPDLNEATKTGSYICLTGSSAFRRSDEKDYLHYIPVIRHYFADRLVFLASTKTDNRIADRIRKKYDITVINEQTSYQQVVEIISNSRFLIGGRFHLSIFSASQGTPFIAIEGNTHKLHGLVKMLNYDIPVCRRGELKDFSSALRLLRELGPESTGRKLQYQYQRLQGTLGYCP